MSFQYSVADSNADVSEYSQNNNTNRSECIINLVIHRQNK